MAQRALYPLYPRGGYRCIRNERVNVAYFTPMKTARIITADRGRTRKYSAAVGTCTLLLHWEDENENCEAKHGVRFMGKARKNRAKNVERIGCREGI